MIFDVIKVKINKEMGRYNTTNLKNSLNDILDIPEIIQKISSGKMGKIKPTMSNFLKPLPWFILPL